MIPLEWPLAALVALGPVVVSGCGSGAGDSPSVPSEGGGAGTVDAGSVLEALVTGSIGSSTSLGKTRWLDATSVSSDEVEVRAKLLGLTDLARGKKVDKHHSVARVVFGEGTFLYVGPTVAGGEGLDLVYFERGVGARAVPGIEARYAESWNGSDRAVRDQHLSSSFEPAGSYVDPRIQAADRAALAEAIASFRKAPGLPDLTLVGTTRAVQGDYLTFSWAIGDSPGLDIAHVSAGGKLDRVIGFY